VSGVSGDALTPVKLIVIGVSISHAEALQETICVHVLMLTPDPMILNLLPANGVSIDHVKGSWVIVSLGSVKISGHQTKVSNS